MLRCLEAGESRETTETSRTVQPIYTLDRAMSMTLFNPLIHQSINKAPRNMSSPSLTNLTEECWLQDKANLTAR